jgi:hypothetical protein
MNEAAGGALKMLVASATIVSTKVVAWSSAVWYKAKVVSPSATPRTDTLVIPMAGAMRVRVTAVPRAGPNTHRSVSEHCNVIGGASNLHEQIRVLR